MQAQPKLIASSGECGAESSCRGQPGSPPAAKGIRAEIDREGRAQATGAGRRALWLARRNRTAPYPTESQQPGPAKQAVTVRRAEKGTGSTSHCTWSLEAPPQGALHQPLSPGSSGGRAILTAIRGPRPNSEHVRLRSCGTESVTTQAEHSGVVLAVSARLGPADRYGVGTREKLF